MGVSTAGCADTCTSRPSWAAIRFTPASASRESALWRALHVLPAAEYISDKIHNLPHVLEERKKANTKQMSLERIRQKETIWLGEQAKLTAENMQVRAYLHRVVQIKKRQAGVFCR